MKKIKHGLIEQGIKLREKGEYQKAIDTFILAKSDPTLFTQACYELAFTNAHRGLMVQAREELSEALKIEPTDPEFTTLSGILYIVDGDETSAIAVLKDTIALYPDYSKAAQLLRNIYRESKDYAAEHDLFVYLLPTYKDDAEFLFEYSVFMLGFSQQSNQQSFQESLTFLEKIKKDGFEDETLEFYIAKAHFRLGHYQECITHIDNFLTERRKQNPSAQRYSIHFRVDKNDAPIFKNSVPALQKHGDIIFVTHLDESKGEKPNLQHGPVFMPGEVANL